MGYRYARVKVIVFIAFPYDNLIFRHRLRTRHTVRCITLILNFTNNSYIDFDCVSNYLRHKVTRWRINFFYNLYSRLFRCANLVTTRKNQCCHDSGWNVINKSFEKIWRCYSILHLLIALSWRNWWCKGNATKLQLRILCQRTLGISNRTIFFDF